MSLFSDKQQQEFIRLKRNENILKCHHSNKIKLLNMPNGLIGFFVQKLIAN